MNAGEVVLISVPQARGGLPKLRPALVLGRLPGPFQNLLICGISTQLRDLQPEWDELIDSRDADFVDSGLHRTSAIRLSYLFAVESQEIEGVIGRIDSARLRRLVDRLARHLVA